MRLGDEHRPGRPDQQLVRLGRGVGEDELVHAVGEAGVMRQQEGDEVDPDSPNE